jgi:predicted transcriptional regulator
MPESLESALKDPGPHTADSLAARLPAFPREAIQQALDLLTDQGVLKREEGPAGEPQYVYVDPTRYAHANRDVIVNPGDAHNRRRR